MYGAVTLDLGPDAYAVGTVSVCLLGTGTDCNQVVHLPLRVAADSEMSAGALAVLIRVD